MPDAENLQLQGPCRAEAIPKASPLVLDFGLNDFKQVGLIEYWLANELAAGYCGKYLFLQENQACPMHSHQVKHETFYPLKGCFEVTCQGYKRILLPGESMAIPTKQVHGFKAIQGHALLLELSMPCDPADNQFQDPRIMQWLNTCLNLP